MRRILKLALMVMGSIAGLAQNSPAPKPRAEHKKLEAYVGRCSFVGEDKMSPSKTNTKVTDTWNVEWMSGGFFTEARNKGGSMRSVFTLMLGVFLAALGNACSTTPAPDQPAVAAPPDPLVADSAHYSLLFENDLARFISVKLPPGSKSVMHEHSAGCTIILAGATTKSTSDAGDAQTSESKPGEISCGNAYAHLPENVGTTDLELILLELKNRKTFDAVQTGRSSNDWRNRQYLRRR